MKDFNKEIKSWIFYDFGNSAYATTVIAAFFPLFYASYWSNGLESLQATQYLGVGNQPIGAAVDFSNAGRGLTVPSLQNRNFMLPPKVTTTERGNLAGLAAGAIIYNTTTNKLQVYNGSTWQNLH